MDDEEAIELFVKDGGVREDWPLVDPGVRLYYRLAPAHGFEPQFTASKADVLPLDEAGKGNMR